LVADYYSWEWGNSLFVVLDPFRYERPRSEENWWVSLGAEQYEWLEQTLAESNSTFKFVFIHHLVGGVESNRGGAEASEFFEWGGKNFDERYSFDRERPGWAMPIHDLMVKNDVSIVFHGHDHMYIQQERDGIVYQLVQQPGHPRGGINSAEPYGYLSGTAVAGSGHLRVAVSTDRVEVDYVRSALAERENAPGPNREILHSYTVDAK
jgi:3',5'-cyclic AMP phosphodiesterase CpdA